MAVMINVYITLGLSQGEFTELKVLTDGVMTDVTTLVGGGGTVETARYPLVITGSNIGINTSLFLPTSSECGKIVERIATTGPMISRHKA